MPVTRQQVKEISSLLLWKQDVCCTYYYLLHTQKISRSYFFLFHILSMLPIIRVLCHKV